MWSSSGCVCGGLAAAELKKNEDETDGKEETESELWLDGRWLERGEDGSDGLGSLFIGNACVNERNVDALVLILSSMPDDYDRGLLWDPRFRHV